MIEKECLHEKTIEKDGFIVCIDCGLCLEKIMVHDFNQKQTRVFINETSNQRNIKQDLFCYFSEYVNEKNLWFLYEKIKRLKHKRKWKMITFGFLFLKLGYSREMLFNIFCKKITKSKRNLELRFINYLSRSKKAWRCIYG